MSVTISPLHFILPMGEVTAEVRLADRLGVAVVLGAGVVSQAVTDTPVSVYEAGASLRYYLTGSFRTGAQIGAEVLYLYASTDETDTMTVAAEGLGVSPFIGYKWTHRSGLTLEAQGGVTWFAVRSTTNTAEEERHFGPMLNLNIGYSF